LDNSIRKQIDKYLDKLKISGDPRNIGKALSADLSGLWRYRIGDYRIPTGSAYKQETLFMHVIPGKGIVFIHTQ
jgi:mRNA-degrading endonuclease RelE of RelBE toxin-antitoxin system